MQRNQWAKLAGKSAVVALICLWALTDAEAVPYGQKAQLLAADGTAGEFLGWDVALCGTTAIVSNINDDYWGTGTGYSGAAYIFEKDVSGWTQMAKLLSDDGAEADYFGESVGISGSIAIVGAPYNVDCGTDSGAAYIFEKGVSGWSQTAKLVPDDAAANDLFGHAVAVNGNIAIVGAWKDDDCGANSGAAYVFEKGVSGWTQVAKLLPDDGKAADYFGWSVALSGDTALVGATPYNFEGAAYVFKNGASGWTQVAKLLPDDGEGGDQFGCSVALNGNTALIGAYKKEWYAAGVEFGAAYVFENGTSGWSQVAQLLPADRQPNDWFGRSVALTDTMAVVGCMLDDDNGDDSGSATVFEKAGSGWVRIGTIYAEDAAQGDMFGRSVAAWETTVLVGSSHNDDQAENAGAAFIFEPVPEPTTLGLFGLAGTVTAWLSKRRRGRTSRRAT